MKISITFEIHNEWLDPGSDYELPTPMYAALAIKDLVVNTSEFKHVEFVDWVVVEP